MEISWQWKSLSQNSLQLILEWVRAGSLDPTISMQSASSLEIFTSLFLGKGSVLLFVPKGSPDDFFHCQLRLLQNPAKNQGFSISS